MPKSKGLIKIQSKLFKTDDEIEMLEMSVFDNGPGISAEDQLKLFKPFVQLSATKSLNPNGNGLGLNICKMIAKNLGGDIDVESDGKTWTKFKFWAKVKSS